ncbi:unnamed protein product [Microthlaspi erraticum]|uniref:Uncharacterized protein n=1 Tax=Microthlaspi erraticum TaxID=1685480 RepID=A0A6D2JKJ1_9BRAS|nr:unnamed protein product [Microthlaspi erraticum]
MMYPEPWWKNNSYGVVPQAGSSRIPSKSSSLECLNGSECPMMRMMMVLRNFIDMSSKYLEIQGVSKHNEFLARYMMRKVKREYL